MLKYNHYLKELGVKETDYPFGDKTGDDSRYVEDEEGFKSSEFWSLDFTFACYIYSHLRFFKEHCLIAHPAYISMQEGENILDKMIKAFELYIKEDNSSKNKQKQIKYGMRLFIKYFGHLGY